MNIFFTADPHFFHRNIIRYCMRHPAERTNLFIDEYEMNEYIADKWNSVVKPNDCVRLLGDVALCKNFSDLKGILKKLNGKIHIITGNHDNHSSLIRARLDCCGLASVVDGVMLFDNRYLLSHYPVDDPKYVNLHGHLHEKPDPSTMHINVGVDRWDFTPVPIEEIDRIVKSRGL